MVKYYGRAKTRVGSVNTTQLGLKMSGCPSKVGLSGQNNRYIQQRVSCMRGICGIPLVNGAIWRHTLRNKHPFCAEPSHKCLAAAGGIGNINTPYYKTLQAGKEGCGYGHPASGDKHRAFPDSLKLTAGFVPEDPVHGGALAGYRGRTQTVPVPGKKFGSLTPTTVPGSAAAGAGADIEVFSLFTNYATPPRQLLVGITHPQGQYRFPFSRLIIRNSNGEILINYGADKFQFSRAAPNDFNFVVWDVGTFGFNPGSTYTIQFLL